MMRRTDLPRDERILQLMAERATEGLSPRDSEALNNYLARNPDVDCDALDYAAAAVSLAFGVGLGRSLPVRLRDRIYAEAVR